MSRERRKKIERKREDKFWTIFAASIYLITNSKYSAFNFRIDLLFLNELVERCVERAYK